MTCNYQHDLCKHRKDCVFRYGNKFTSKISKEIAYYMRLLDGLYSNLKLYDETMQEITDGMYDGEVNVFGNIIQTPSDVYYNLNINLIEKNIEITKNTINELTKEENKVIKTLKRKERRRKQYGI